jgi:CRP-like cAMP-binding protein
VQTQNVAAVIRNTLCRSLTVPQAAEIAAATVPVGVPKGGFVFRQGDKSDGMLIFVRGAVEILRQGSNGDPRVIATVNAPTVIGEMGLVTGLVTDRPRSATVRATADCEFHLLTKREFERMLASEQLSALKLVVSLADVLARRLEAADDRLIAMSEPPALPGVVPAPPPIAELAALREKLFSEWSF